MLGWEFPPHFAGGAGIVCSELSHALNRKNTDVTFLMPSGPQDVYDDVSKTEPGQPQLKIRIANNEVNNTTVEIRKVQSIMKAYDSFSKYEQRLEEIKEKKEEEADVYGDDLEAEVYRFAEKASVIAKEEDFDVIHAHDWVTFPAAVKISKETGIPLVVHVHITEFDKSGNLHADPFIYDIEQTGMKEADRVITVSERVKKRCVTHYHIDSEKIRVVHNGATEMNDEIHEGTGFKKGRKMVLFAGRVTMQKGPEYFVEAAKKVSELEDDIVFVVAGDGDKLPMMKEMVQDYGLEDKFYFHGFYTRDEAEKLFSMADVFVMPSVSEPFGVVPYEAQMKKTPAVISKQSGISEVLDHALKVDFWDINKMAKQIITLLNYEEMHNEMKEEGYVESKTANWDEPAKKCLNVYNEVI